MATKLFKETDSWGDLINENGTNVSFSTKKTNKEKKVKARKRNHSEIEENSGGMWIRAPKYYGLEESDKDFDTPKTLKRKNRKRKHSDKQLDDDEVAPEKKSKEQHVSQPSPTSKTFGDKLRESLKGSRFRYINELLYTQNSQEAMKIFEEDQTAFGAYHDGFRHQISQWPMNPLDRIIKQIKKMPKDYVIVDMGCGDARLATSVLQKVYSIDLVSDVEGVIKADMAKVPLESNSVNVVVYCLSLMGTNLTEFLIEANRLLKLNGLVKIAEVSSRFEKVNAFIDFVQKCGFELVSKDINHELFYFMTFKKTHDVNSFNKRIASFSLKPCLYKKR